MTTRRPPVVVGSFSDSAMAERAIQALKEAGFRENEIGYSTHRSFFESLKDWLRGEGSPSTNDIAEDLKHMGVPADAADHYAMEHQANHPLVVVRSPGHEQDAMSILRNYGGDAYGAPAGAAGTAAASGAAYGTARTPEDTGTTLPPSAPDEPVGHPAGPSGYGQPGPRSTTSSVTGGARIPIREEQLQVEKQDVQRGEVRVRKEIVTEQRSIDVPVSHEEIVVERHAAGEATPSERSPVQDEEMRIPISEEQVNITKTPVETGDVTINKRTVQEEKRFTENVQREEPYIEQTGDIPIWDQEEQQRDQSQP